MPEDRTQDVERVKHDQDRFSMPRKIVDGVTVRVPDGYPNEAQCPDCGSWYPWFDQEFSCPGCGWVPPAKRWSR